MSSLELLAIAKRRESWFEDGSFFFCLLFAGAFANLFAVKGREQVLVCVCVCGTVYRVGKSATFFTSCWLVASKVYV